MFIVIWFTFYCVGGVCRCHGNANNTDCNTHGGYTIVTDRQCNAGPALAQRLTCVASAHISLLGSSRIKRSPNNTKNSLSVIIKLQPFEEAS